MRVTTTGALGATSLGLLLADSAGLTSCSLKIACFRMTNIYYACMDAFGGARYVIRHCTLVNTHPGGHGTEGQRSSGVRAVEVYNNTMTHTRGGIIGNVRGGVAIYHDNTATGVSTWGIRLQCQRVRRSFHLWRTSDGTSIYDVNQNGVLVHAIDQPGRAEGGLISGGRPPVLPQGWNDQVTDPCYAWNNTFNGQPTLMYGEQVQYPRWRALLQFAEAGLYALHLSPSSDSEFPVTASPSSGLAALGPESAT